MAAEASNTAARPDATLRIVVCFFFAPLVPCCAMLPAVTAKQNALDAALTRLAGGPIDRPDTPDLHVTAVRQLPEAAARYAPFPDTLDARLVAALRTRGIAQLYSHQAEAIAH